ncbi:hypothetical protein CEXT_711021 [Caerostris extrusa]|uniref:Uncharacterized protein n=1 Tax=Caerostris extrusa TaxID=172846 RepID=A0AAV4TKJ0_CAEEX|nr:hypothetical protein CEXT_711021 [Caerostris extrusa]
MSSTFIKPVFISIPFHLPPVGLKFLLKPANLTSSKWENKSPGTNSMAGRTEGKTNKQAETEGEVKREEKIHQTCLLSSNPLRIIIPFHLPLLFTASPEASKPSQAVMGNKSPGTNSMAKGTNGKRKTNSEEAETEGEVKKEYKFVFMSAPSRALKHH